MGAKTLKKLITTKVKQPLDDIDLTQDLKIIENFYQDQGFLSAKVDRKIESTKKGKIVYFLISEGERVRISAISLTGFAAFSEEKIMNLLGIKIGSFLIAPKLDEAIERGSDFYKNSGYPYVLVEHEVKINNNQADVYFSIQEGPLSYIKEVKIRGNRGVKTWTILRACEIKLGEKFSQEHLYQAQRRLYAARLFDRVSFYVSGMEERKDSLTVRFDVSELSPRGFTFGLGYQLPPNRFLFGIGWEHLNILNRGQNLNINSEFTPNFKGDYELDLEAIYKVPYLIKVPLNFTTSPFLNLEREQGYYTTEYGLETGIDRYLGANWGINLLNRFRRFSFSDTSKVDSLIRRGITNSLILNITYDSRNSFFNPSQGIYFSPLAEAAGGLLMGDNDFYRTTVELRIFHALAGWLVVAFRGYLGATFPYGRTKKIPYFEEFSIGGRNTLRGYDERSIGPDSVGKYYFGTFMLNNNLEMRIGYFKNFGLTLFFDSGDIKNRFNDFKISSYQYSIGIGLIYNTPVGPIRVDYGKRLKNPPTNDHGKLYFGLLHAF